MTDDADLDLGPKNFAAFACGAFAELTQCCARRVCSGQARPGCGVFAAWTTWLCALRHRGCRRRHHDE